MLVDSFDYIACYKGLHPNLDTAIDWLNSHTLDALENGRTIIDGENVFGRRPARCRGHSV